MRRKRWWVGGLILALAAGVSSCAGPTEAECQTACRNVVEVFAAGIQGQAPERAAEVVDAATALATDCQTSCQSSDAHRVRCLAAARTVRALNECNL